MKRSKKDLIKTIQTGKIPVRRNLFKLLFKLADLSQIYGGIQFSDGYSGRRRSRVVLRCSISHINKAHLERMQEYVTDLEMRKNKRGLTTFLYHLKDVDWPKIDEHTKSRN